MTDQEMNVEVATACGWMHSEEGWWSHPTLPDNGGAEPNPPDYGADLNAMHEAEKVLDDMQYSAYENLFWSLMAQEKMIPTPTAAGGSIFFPASRIRMSSPTASQRREAFLRTVGKMLNSNPK